MKEEFSRSRLSQIFLDNLPCVALLLRPSTREIVASNPAAVKVGAVPGTTCFATWGQRDNPCPWCLAPELWKTGKAQHLEVEADGVVWDAYWAPVGPDLYMHYAFDITGRKRMEDALRDSAETLRALLNAIPESIFLIDANRAIVAANETLAQRLGKGMEEAVGAKIAEILPAEVAKRRKARADEVFRTGKAVRFEDVRDGRSFDNFLHPIMDAAGKVAKLAVFSLDITERRQAEKALEESLSLQKATLESTADGLLVVDLQGRMVSWNRKFVDMWRMPEEICASQDDSQALAYVLDQVQDPEGFLRKIKQLYAHPKVEDYDYILFKDGRVFERHSIPQYLNKQAVGRVWSFRDVTARVRAEEALRASLRFLEIAPNQLDIDSLLKAFVSEIKENAYCLSSKKVTV